jgi:HK97 family phage major capsid protein
MTSNAEMRLEELIHEVARKTLDGTCTNKFMDGVERESERLRVMIKNEKAARKLAGSASPAEYGITGNPGDYDGVTTAGLPRMKALGGGAGRSEPKWSPPSPLDASPEQWQQLFIAAHNRLPSFSQHVGTTAKGLPEGVRDKAAFGEGSPGTLLPPQLLPQALNLRYEPDRLFSHFVAQQAPESQSVSYLRHTGNTNPAAPVAELGTKPDLGMQISPTTVSFTKIAALSSFSREVLSDFSEFLGFVPSEMTRAVIDKETDQIVNGDGTGANMTGILHTSGVLTRSVGTDTPIDALVKSCNDIRVGSSFGTANLIALHPSDWTDIKTSKNAQGSYLLTLNTPNDIGNIGDLFGVPIITNTHIPQGTALTMDTSTIMAWTRWGLELAINQYGETEWSTNAWSFRCEERIAVGITRPSSIVVTTGLT